MPTEDDLERWVESLPAEYFEQLVAHVGASGSDGMHPWNPRPEQAPPPGNWFVWFFRAGRGTGKTRAAAEWVRSEIEDYGPLRVACVAPTFAQGRDVMFEGESGLLNIIPERLMPKGREFHWNRSIGELKLGDGSFIKLLSSEKPGALRGHQWNRAWVDEAAEFKDAALGTTADTTWTNLVLATRLDGARIMVTGTPKPVALVKALVERCETNPKWVETRGRTYDNLENLSPAFRDEVVSMYEGTRLGRQELEGELLEGLGDLFQVDWLRWVESVPRGRRWRARVWDLAATEPSQDNQNPDWTVGSLLSLDPKTRSYCLEHMARFRKTPGARDQEILRVAMRDREQFGANVRVWIEQEPGSGGKSQVEALKLLLDGVARVDGHLPSGKKFQRALVPAGIMEQGRFYVVKPTLIVPDDPTSGAEWDLAAFTTELAEFREDEKHPHDDIIDTLSTFCEVAPKRGGDVPAPISITH
jgi:phage terminase large subunit-like protein